MKKLRFALLPLALLMVVQIMVFLYARRLRSQYLAQDVGPDRFNAVVVTEGKQEKITSQTLRGGFIRVVMGGLDLDLRGARLRQRPAIVEATVAYGGLDMKVPGDWTVNTEVTSILGGVSSRPPRAAEGEVPDLLLKGRIIFGGIDVR